MTAIQGAANSIPSAGSSYYEKTLADVNDVDEGFDNARDLGYLRYNTYRVSVAATLSEKHDASDMYKIKIQSKNKLTLSFRNSEGGSESKAVDYSKYDKIYKELLAKTDPEAYNKLIEEENAAERKSNLLSYTAPGFQVQVYMKDS